MVDAPCPAPYNRMPVTELTDASVVAVRDGEDDEYEIRASLPKAAINVPDVAQVIAGSANSVTLLYPEVAVS